MVAGKAVGTGMLLEHRANVEVNSTGNSSSFAVSNDGPSQTYSVSCTFDGVNCSPASQNVTVGGSNADTISFNFNAGGTLGPKNLTVTASGGGDSDTVIESVSVDPAGVTVSVDSPPGPVEQYDSDQATFLVSTDLSTDDVNLYCDWPGVSCNVTPNNVTFSQPGDTVAAVSFEVGGLSVGSHTLEFWATDATLTYSDTTSISVQVEATSSSQSITITPTSASGDTILNDDALSADFEILYDDAAEPDDAVAFVCEVSGPITCGGVSPSNLPVNVQMFPARRATRAVLQ